ncbi:beta-L-arabinofuranosidase domain-containing protein [Mucilaginibacter hurinus]|nr:beta-L-arabinofuranosidase domain-containing protein [Mucilaginibacter hurinus]
MKILNGRYIMIKKIGLFALGLAGFFQHAKAQRYLASTFTLVDSVVNIQYGSAPDYKNKKQNLLLDFYEPRDDKAAKRPLVIYVHGGGFTEGTRKWPSVKIMCEKMAQRGYAVASIDYRLDPTFKGFYSNTDRRAIADAMHDLKAAIRFFKANQAKYRIDTVNIITGGESAGAITAMAAAYNDKPHELKNLPKANPYNTEGASGNPGFSTRPKGVLCLCGTGDTSAIEKPTDPPLLIVHNTIDPFVPFELADMVIKRAKNIGINHQVIIYKGKSHCPWYYGLPNWQKYMDSTVNHMSRFIYDKVLDFGEKNAFKKISAIPEKYHELPFSAVKPGGWLKAQIQDNLNGYTGHLDSLVPDLAIKDDIYGRDRLTKKVKSKDVGAQGGGGGGNEEDTSWQVQFLWWNSETQSNWRDGYIRSAILANDKEHLSRIAKYVKRILSTQDADGYLGIYDKELRYKFDQENGELWAKATLLRGLLAWYDYTKDKTVLNAVIKAVDNVMINWPINKSQPFLAMKPDVSGLSHGLTFTDVLESVYRLTGNQKYNDYLVFLYKDFSAQAINEDAQYKKLRDTSFLLKGHGVHTYEHLRTVAAAYYLSGNPELKIALKNFLDKIELATTASGGPVSDEWVGNRADATNRGYEYCSLHELLHSYASLSSKSGSSEYGSKIEKLFFNAAQGARHPNESCIAYLKTDNSYAMEGWRNLDSADKHQVRYKYSPVHQDAAVCCVPNAGRIAPYYVQNMWLKGGNSLVASLLGPSEVNTTINGKPVIVKQTTEYPYTNSLTFEVSATNNKFDLKIRKPEWADKFTVSEKYREEDGFIVISKNWNGRQKIKIDFMPEVKINRDVNNEVYFTYGALVLANPIAANEAKGKSFPLPGYYDYRYTPQELTVYQYAGNKVTKQAGKNEFTTELYDAASGQTKTVMLQPISNTILRQVTFKQK